MFRVLLLVLILTIAVMNYSIIVESLEIILASPPKLFLLSFFLLIVEFFFQSFRLHPIVNSDIFTTAKAYLIGLSTALFITPRPVGELTRAEVMARYLKVDRSKTLAYISLERILDVFLLISFSILMIFKNIVLSVFVFVSLSALFFLVGNKIGTVLLRSYEKLPNLLHRYLNDASVLLMDGTYFALVTVLTFLLWLIDFTRVYIIMSSFGLNLTFLESAALTSISYLSGVLSVLPGGLGIYEAVMSGVLALKGPLSRAIAATIYERFFSYWLILFPGLALAAIEGRKLQSHKKLHNT